MQFLHSIRSVVQYLGGLFAVTFFPLIASAQPTTFAELVDLIVGIINLIVPAIFGVLFVFLMWKVFDSWVINAGDQAKREEGKRYATTAVIVFFVMMSVWGIVAMILISIFG